MSKIDPLIALSSFMAHIINGDDSLPKEVQTTAFKTWEIHQKVTDLLCFPQYKPHKSRAYQSTPQYLYCLVGHQMASDQTAEISVARYFERVFEYQIGNPKQLPSTPTEKLTTLLADHRLFKPQWLVADKVADAQNINKAQDIQPGKQQDRQDKLSKLGKLGKFGKMGKMGKLGKLGQQGRLEGGRQATETQLSEPQPTATSLWTIFLRAGKSYSGEPVQYSRWQDGEFIALCQYISDILRSANRHYGEIFRMGLYPPDWMDVINVSQARKINQLIQPKRELGHDNPEWIEQSRQRWDKYAIKQFDGEKLDSFDDFLATDLGRCLTGEMQAKPVIIGDYDFSRLDKEGEEDDSYLQDYDIDYDAQQRLTKLRQVLSEANHASVNHASVNHASVNEVDEHLSDHSGLLELDKTDKAILLQVINEEVPNLDSLKVRRRYMTLALDESGYIDYLGKLIEELLNRY